MRRKVKGLFWVFALLNTNAVLGGEFADPTAPLKESVRVLSMAQKDKAPLRLALIIIGPKTRMAIINGRRYREHDRVGDFKLLSIEKNIVTLVNGEESVKLSISPIVVREWR